MPPNFELLQEIRNQGEIVINCRANGNFQPSSSNGSSAAQALTTAVTLVHRQPARAASSPNNGDPLLWDHSTTESSSSAGSNASSHVTSAKTYASIVKPAAAAQIIGQCIPGSSSHIAVKPALAPSETFEICIILFLFHRFTFLKA